MALKETQKPASISAYWAKKFSVASCGGSLQDLSAPWGHHGNIIPSPHQNVFAFIRVISQRL